VYKGPAIGWVNAEVIAINRAYRNMARRLLRTALAL